MNRGFGRLNQHSKSAVFFIQLKNSCVFEYESIALKIMKTLSESSYDPVTLDPKSVIISIKPEYAIKIIEGQKTIELRRRFPLDNIIGGIAMIYASSPIQQIIGYTIIKDVKKLPLSDMWFICQDKACITKEFFNAYFKDLKEGFAIFLSHPVRLENPVNAKQLEKKYSIAIPQSFRYVSNEILKAVEA